MTELPDDLRRALAELPRERQPDPALEDRVVRAALRPRRREWWVVAAVAAAAALLIVVTRPWSMPPETGQRYVLLLSEPPDYIAVPPGHLGQRRAEYARWADSLAHLGKLDFGSALDGPGEVDGLFIIRAADDSDAARIAATCPHNKYRGHIEIRRSVGVTDVRLTAE